MDEKRQVAGPSLSLSNGSAWEVVLTALATEEGLPITLRFRGRIRFEHSAGEFIYTVDDLTFLPEELKRFSEAFCKLAKGEASHCVLKSVGEEIQLFFERAKGVRLEVKVSEIQMDSRAFAQLILPIVLPDFDSVDRLQRWTSEFVEALDSWIAMQSVPTP